MTLASSSATSACSSGCGRTTPSSRSALFAHQLSVVLTNRWWRTFGATDELLGEGIRFDLDFDIAYIEGEGEGTGLQLNLAAGLDVTFDVGWKLGDRPPAANADDPNAAKRGFFDLTIHSIRVHLPIEATEESFDVRAEVRFHASMRLGPVVLVIDGLGGWVGWWAEGTPPEKEWIGFLPPTGAGVQLQLPGIVGGGFLDFTGGPNERFAGLLYLRISTFEVTAFGIHELTGQPGDARRKTSFIVVIGIRFSPGIQLGYGFAITGFGGLVGINRRADTDALRERLTSGAAGNVLFAEDPVRNAPAIIGDLGALFPPADGVYVFGPTVQISWLSVGSGEAGPVRPRDLHRAPGADEGGAPRLGAGLPARRSGQQDLLHPGGHRRTHRLHQEGHRVRRDAHQLPRDGDLQGHGRCGVPGQLGRPPLRAAHPRRFPPRLQSRACCVPGADPAGAHAAGAEVRPVPSGRGLLRAHDQHVAVRSPPRGGLPRRVDQRHRLRQPRRLDPVRALPLRGRLRSRLPSA